jgi:AcrR family transcriptional regulator
MKKMILSDNMSKETEEIIRDTALKIFAEEGYVGAKTRVIAESSGFSEMTLFRKFKTKENLFNAILMEQKEYLLGEASVLFSANKTGNPVESFKLLIQHVYKLMEENFHFISLYINERRRLSESILDEFVICLSHQIELKFPNTKINAKVFAFNILSFLYLLIFDKYRNYSFRDHKKALNEFIENCTLVLTA